MAQSLTTLQSTALGPVLTASGVSATVAATTIAPPGIQTAVDIAGGETVTVTGSGFNAGITAYINATSCSTTYGNSTSLTFTTPATSAGTYNVTLYNTDGTTGTRPGGIIFSTPPIWVTAAGELTAGIANTAYSNTVSATGTGIAYSVTSGALPTGLSLNSSSGAITGTPTVANTYNFTITATNNYNQPTARAFSILIASVVPTTTLVVAGGGSGGTGYYGGGGGAGGYIESSTNLSLGVTYTITVGTGGVGTTTQTNKGGTGGNSSITGSGFTTITALGGGGGGSNGADGGSGGGVGFSYPGTDVNGSAGGGSGLQPASASGGLGNKGAGQKSPALGYRMDGGGGGGAGAAANPSNLGTNPGMSNGAIGSQSSITGTSTYYGGGGAGGIGGQPGGSGGGGSTGVAGTANTGGGGGGGNSNNAQGGNGGSGVVIIKYPDTYAAATTTGSPTITAITGYRIYKFTGTGTFVVN